MLEAGMGGISPIPEDERTVAQAILEKLNIHQGRASSIQPNVLLVVGEDEEGGLQRHICKRPRNASPLFANGQERESLFYDHFSSDLSDIVPNRVGEIEGFEIFQYLETDQPVDPNGMLNLLPAIQQIKVPDSAKPMLAGEYDDKERFLAYLDQIRIGLGENPTHREIASFLNHDNVFSDALEYLRGLPQVLTHGDFWRGNAIQSNQKLYLIDWENCQVNNNYYDLSTLLNTEKFMFGNENFQLPNMESADEVALEYNFVLQTVSQVLPELITNNPEKSWIKTWLLEFVRILDKYGSNE